MHIVYLEPRALYIDHDYNALVGHNSIELPGDKHLIWQVFSGWANKETPDDLHLISKDPDTSFLDLMKGFTLMEAAGGIVENPSGDILMIYRLGKWDLPKGKLDTGESPEKGAMREVEEECGIDALTISGELPQTYHAYRINESWVLKKTQWYAMQTNKYQHPTPQTTENITKAVWLHKEETKKLLEQAYRSIADLMHFYLK